MAIASSRITSQGQISVPAEVRRRLGLAPGSILQWEEVNGEIVVRKSGRRTSLDIHRELFPKGPPRARSLDELKTAVRRHVRQRRGRG